MMPSKRSSFLTTLLFMSAILFSWTLLSADEGHDHGNEVSASADVETPITNEYCPVMTDEEIDPDISVEYKGKTVFLCCKMCKRQFLEDPEKYVANLPQFAESEILEVASEEPHDHAETHDEAMPMTMDSEMMDEHSNASHEHGTGHDHATDHGDQNGSIERVVKFGGKFHPVIVHFPIALGLVALLVELLSFFTKKEMFRSTGRTVIVLAALGAMVTAPLGWAAALGANYPSLEETLEWHRWIGTGAVVLLIGSAILSEIAARKENKKIYKAYLTILIIAAISTGIAGHLGATLIYGPDHFTF